MSQNSGMKMTIKIGPEEIKEVIKQYMKLRLGPTLKISPVNLSLAIKLSFVNQMLSFLTSLNLNSCDPRNFE